MLYGIDSNPQNIPHMETECGEYSVEYCESHRTHYYGSK